MSIKGIHIKHRVHVSASNPGIPWRRSMSRHVFACGVFPVRSYAEAYRSANVLCAHLPSLNSCLLWSGLLINIATIEHAL